MSLQPPFIEHVRRTKMLFERQNVRQIEGEGLRRWFSDDYFDLIVWYDPQEENRITGFQLCYDKSRNERALTWRRRGGYTHDRIDDGEVIPGPKQSPVLVPDGIFDRQKIAEKLREKSVDIDPLVAEFVHKKILEYGG